MERASQRTEQEVPAPNFLAVRTSTRRRVIYLSVANCSSFPEAATAGNLSRHVGKVSGRGAMLVEFVGMVRPTANYRKLHHVVQLVGTM